MTAIQRGRLAKWNTERGFGFIRPDGSDRAGDIFVHVTAMEASGLVPTDILGKPIEFDLTPDPRHGRPRATRIVVLPEGGSIMPAAPDHARASAVLPARRPSPV